MARKISVSQTGQNQKPPTREERDEAFSHDGGRKAVEVPLAKNCKDGERKQCSSHSAKGSEPIGLQMETKADQLLEESE